MKFVTLLLNVICVLSISLTYAKQRELIVETKLGRIRGIEAKSSWNERPFAQFKGIPYANPPIGKLRFKSPSKFEEPWQGVRDGSKYGSTCPQMNALNDSVIEGNEDCLYLNVFVPKISEEKLMSENRRKLPVLVFIHGGSFQYESGSDYDPSHWMEEDLIVVTFNHRLSIFGFLKLPKNQIYGNMGMKDQVTLLKWVEENIEAFGGDPSRVTIMGVNSGAVSVHLHMLSPMSKGLFHQAISQSGTALDPWGMPHKDRTGLIAKMLRCDKNLDLIDCLGLLTSEQIILVQGSFNDWYIDPLVPMGPIVESTNEDESDIPSQRFLTESPLKIMTDGNYNAVPWILGVNKDEGLLHSADIKISGGLLRVLDWEWVKAAPITLIYPAFTREKSLEVSKSIRKYYFDNDTFVENPSLIFERLTSMYSDRYFFRGAHHSAKMHAATKTPTYLYMFDRPGTQSLSQLSEGTANKETPKSIQGVAHYDQIPYFFNTPYFAPVSDEVEIEMAKSFVRTFAAFVIDGIPSGDWKAVSDEAVTDAKPLPYNRLSLIPEVLDETFTERIRFWDSIIPLSEESGKQTVHKDWEDKKEEQEAEKLVEKVENDFKDKDEL